MARKPLSSALLLDARRRASLSQRQLARRARTAQSVVARIELGATRPTTETLERLGDAAGVELALTLQPPGAGARPGHAAGFELALTLQPRAVLDRQVLDDVPRILRLSPEDRLREVANLARLLAQAPPPPAPAPPPRAAPPHPRAA